MRRVKFRGLTDAGEWEYGYLVMTPNMDRANIVNKKGINLMQMNDVIPSTVGEFSSFLDETEKEIYEDDIVSFGRDSKYQVVFEDGCFYLYHYEGLKDHEGNPYRWGAMYRVAEVGFAMKVIGNIHQSN